MFMQCIFQLYKFDHWSIADLLPVQNISFKWKGTDLRLTEDDEDKEKRHIAGSCIKHNTQIVPDLLQRVAVRDQDRRYQKPYRHAHLKPETGGIFNLATNLYNTLSLFKACSTGVGGGAVPSKAPILTFYF